MALLAELHEKHANVARDIQGVFDAADNDQRELTADDRTKLANLEASYDKIGGDIATADADEKARKAQAERMASVSKIISRKSRPDTFPNAGHEGNAKIPKFETFGEQLRAVYEASNPDMGFRRDPRLAAVTGSSEGIPSDGGYLVQKDFAPGILQRMYEVGEILKRVRTVEIGANSNQLVLNAIDETSRATGSRVGGIRVYRLTEGQQKPASRPKLRQMTLTLKKLAGMWYATDELLEDATAMESIAKEAFPQEFAFVNEDEIINGDGASQMLGIMNSPAAVSFTAGATLAEGLIYSDIVGMWARLWAGSRSNAVWLINQALEPFLYNLTFPIGTGGIPAFLPPGGLSSSPFSTLFGRPIIPVEYLSAPGTAGDIILADFNQYLMITKGGLKFASSIHLRFDYDETAFRWVMRNDGQPVWNTPLTPYKGTATLSPFVYLSTRT